MANLITVSIGNTRIACAAFVDGQIARSEYELTTAPEAAATHVRNLSQEYASDEVALCSVVPAALHGLQAALRPSRLRLSEIKPDRQRLIKGAYPTLGADRLANVAAALKLYIDNTAAIVLDFGTATTLTAVGPDGSFLGGLITLGLGRTLATLNQSTAQLPHIRPDQDWLSLTALANDTQTAIASGCLLAQAGIVELWITRARRELGQDAKVIGTGGYSSYVAKATRAIDIFDPQLTLKGISILSEHVVVGA